MKIKVNKTLEDINRHYQKAMEFCNLYNISPASIEAKTTHCAIITTSIAKCREINKDLHNDIKISFPPLKSDVYGTIITIISLT